MHQMWVQAANDSPVQFAKYSTCSLRQELRHCMKTEQNAVKINDTSLGT